MTRCSASLLRDDEKREEYQNRLNYKFQILQELLGGNESIIFFYCSYSISSWKDFKSYYFAWLANLKQKRTLNMSTT